jgi:hypothetical protein
MVHTHCCGDGKIILPFTTTVMDHSVIYNIRVDATSIIII